MLVTDLIGNTPLIELKNLWKPSSNTNIRLFCKLEGQNPGGSVKDRPALSMICKAEGRGTIKKGDKLIEPTSGNTGIALAMIASLKGYDLELVMPANASKERVSTMRAYGAKVTLTPAEKSMEGAIDYTKAMVAKYGYIMLDQFSNPDNYAAHYEGTGPEIWEQTNGNISHFVSAMGTTGTIMGVSRYLKEKDISIQIIGAQPVDGSCIPGIRRWSKEYLPKIFDEHRVDRKMDVSQADATAMTRLLAKVEGVFAGMSSGGAVHCALEVCKELDKLRKEATIVVIICDRGDRYVSTDLFE